MSEAILMACHPQRALEDLSRDLQVDLVSGKVTEQDLYKKKRITVLSRHLRMDKD